MTGLIVASAIIGILAAIGGSAATVYQLGVQHLSSKVRSVVSDIASKVTRELKTGRMSVNKLITLLQSKNQNALMTYLYNNPIISKRLDEIQGTNDLVASLQADQANLENEITLLMNELNSLGYNSSVKGSKHDEAKAAQIREELAEKKREYDDLGNKIKATDVSTVNKASTYTADLDARSQNVKGGLVNNVQEERI